MDALVPVATHSKDTFPYMYMYIAYINLCENCI